MLKWLSISDFSTTKILFLPCVSLKNLAKAFFLYVLSGINDLGGAISRTLGFSNLSILESNAQSNTTMFKPRFLKQIFVPFKGLTNRDSTTAYTCRTVIHEQVLQQERKSQAG